MNKHLKIKCFTVFMLLACFYSIGIYAQGQTITINIKNATLKQVLNAIEKQTTYRFSYRNVVIDNRNDITISKKKASVPSVLNIALKGRNLEYSIISNKSIVITDQKAKSTTRPSQRKRISGVVKDANGEPIIGASIYEKGTKNGTITNIDGKFDIEASNKAILTVSFVGYQTTNARASRNMRIVLPEDSKTLEEVVVVGYGAQKRANLTGAVSTVDVKKALEGRSIPDVGRGLQGSVPGLNIVVPDGEIGSDPKFKIRGAIGSLEGGSSPLILLDNVEIPSIQVVNPDDVESISVLKDAASASIYGSKGAFGVILITTKKGAKTNKVSCSYSGLFSWKNLSKDYSIAGVNGLQYMLDCRAREKDSSHTGTYSYDGLYTGSYFRVSQESLAKTKNWINKYGSMGPDDPTVYGRDWYYEGGRIFGIRPYNIYDYIIRENAPTTQHNITVNGRIKNTTFNVGLGYLSESGMLKTSTDNFTKYNASVKVETEVNKWLTIRGGMMFSSRSKKYPFVTESGSDGPWIYLYRWSPLMPLGYNEDGEIIRSSQSETQQAHTQNMKYNYTNINLGLTLNLLKGWTVNADYTYSNEEYIHTLPGSTFSAASYRDTPVVRYDSNGNAIYVNENGEVVDASTDGAMLSYKLPFKSNYNGDSKPNLYKREHENAYRHTLNAYTDYITTFKNIHTMKFMLGMNLSTYDSTSEWAQVTSLTDFDNPQFAFGTGTWTGGGDASWQAQLGFFGRVNYSLMDKYLLEANLRYDGTSKFPKDLRWKWFPSVSAGWRFGEESFMKWAKPTLSSAKLRASWGEIGDQTVSSSLYIPTMDTGFSNWIGGSGTRLFTTGTPSAVSSSISWQRIETINVGLDARFFRNELGVTFDWYQRDTKDMIVPTDGVNEVTCGASAPEANNGQLRTKGWEFSLDYNHRFNNGLHINLTASISDAKSTIKKYGVTKSISDWYVGREYGEIWGFKTDRLYQKSDFETDSNGNLVWRALTADDTDDANCIGKKSYILKAGSNGEKPVYQSYFQGGSFYFGPGDVKYKDEDGNGKLEKGTKTTDDHGDLRKIGNSTPRYEYSFRISADYKGFDLSLFFQGIGSRKIWGQGPLCVPGYKYSDGCMPAAIADDYWTAEHTDAFYPAAQGMGSGNSSYNMMVNDRYILNMAYLRLKNLTIGYTCPLKYSQKVGISKARVFFSAENLLTWDKLRGLPIDPECITGTSMWGSPQGRTGVGAPTSKTVSVGVQLNF